MLKAVLILIVFFAIIDAQADLKVNFIKLNNFTEIEQAKIHKSAKVVTVILNSKEFKERVVNHTYNGKKHFIDTTLSNEQVYEKVMKGAEMYAPAANGNMDIGLEMYYQLTTTIGYTTAKSDTIYLNRKYHNKYDEYDEANNIVHEWTHKLGFDHAEKWSESRDHSVPYGVGYIVDELASIIKENPLALTPINSQNQAPIPAQVEVKPVLKKTVCASSWRTWFRKVCWEE